MNKTNILKYCKYINYNKKNKKTSEIFSYHFVRQLSILVIIFFCGVSMKQTLINQIINQIKMSRVPLLIKIFNLFIFQFNEEYNTQQVL